MNGYSNKNFDTYYRIYMNVVKKNNKSDDSSKGGSLWRIKVRLKRRYPY
ncbi:hypothetical protein EMIT0210MI2_12134 [Priestia megaterium]